MQQLQQQQEQPMDMQQQIVKVVKQGPSKAQDAPPLHMQLQVAVVEAQQQQSSGWAVQR
jgi:hypothetical protein